MRLYKCVVLVTFALILVLRSCNFILSCLRKATGGWIFLSFAFRDHNFTFQQLWNHDDGGGDDDDDAMVRSMVRSMMRWCDTIDDDTNRWCWDAFDDTMRWWCDALRYDRWWWNAMMIRYNRWCDAFDDSGMRWWYDMIDVDSMRWYESIDDTW